MAKNHCYFNGKITTLDKIKISPYDLGILRGYGVFDMMRANGSQPINIREHYKHLQNSAKILDLNLSFNQKEFENIIKRLLMLNGYKNSAIRTVVTGGVSLDTITLSSKPTCYILIEKYRGLPSAIYQKGVRAVTLEYRRENCEAKTNNYIFSIKNQSLKKKKKAFEIIYIKNKKVLEGSSSNIFIVKNGQVITPKKGMFPGCARRTVLSLIKKEFVVLESDVSERDLLNAEEVFLTGSGKNVVPVICIDGKKIGDGKVGKITREIMIRYDRFVKSF